MRAKQLSFIIIILLTTCLNPNSALISGELLPLNKNSSTGTNNNSSIKIHEFTLKFRKYNCKTLVELKTRVNVKMRNSTDSLSREYYSCVLQAIDIVLSEKNCH